MPELPEVETVRRGLAPVMESSVVDRLELRRADLRFPFPDNFVGRVEGQTVTSLGRRGKYLLADLSGGDVIIMHLGMSGSFRTEIGQHDSLPGEFHQPRSRDQNHDHVIFHLRTNTNDAARVIYNDPRRFGFMQMVERQLLSDHPSFKHMGVEPVGNALSSTELASRLDGKRTPIKSALLDQRIIAGLGNIYVCEALWRAGLSPRRGAQSLVRKDKQPTQRLDELTLHIRAVIEEAIEVGGSSLRDHAQTDGSLGYFQHRFAVYDQEGSACKKEHCKGTVQRIVQSGRSTFFCTKCQR